MRFKPTQLWWVLVPVLAASALYFIKFQVRALHDEIAGMERELTRERDAMRVLGAEWSYLNRPQRLQSLMQSYSPTTFVAPVQLADVADLPQVYALVVPPAPLPGEESISLAQAETLPKPVSPARASVARAPYAQLQGQVMTSSLRVNDE